MTPAVPVLHAALTRHAVPGAALARVTDGAVTQVAGAGVRAAGATAPVTA
ncbi:hypothetical protein ABZ379_31660 [Streptomyces canus]